MTNPAPAASDDPGHLLDETGKPSLGRRLLVHWTWVATGMIGAEVAGRAAAAFWFGRLPNHDLVPSAAWTFLGVLFPLLVLWVGLPRAGESWGGILGGVARTIRGYRPAAGAAEPGAEGSEN